MTVYLINFNWHIKFKIYPFQKVLMIHQLAGKLFFMTLAFINKVVDQPAFDNHSYWIRTNHHRGFHPQVIFDEKKKFQTKFQTSSALLFLCVSPHIIVCAMTFFKNTTFYYCYMCICILTFVIYFR